VESRPPHQLRTSANTERLRSADARFADAITT
jgi:hypothetical protein